MFMLKRSNIWKNKKASEVEYLLTLALVEVATILARGIFRANIQFWSALITPVFSTV